MLNGSPIPTIGDQFPMRYSRFWQKSGRLVMRLTGWKMIGHMPDLPQFVAVGGPHTVLRDTQTSIMTLLAIGGDVRIMVKRPAFDWPIIGWMLRRANCIPIDRQSPDGIVGQMVSWFERDNFILAIAPEGTRTEVTRLKTGFYRIAEAAELPILPIAFDRKNKTMQIHDLVYPSGDMDAQVGAIFDIFNEVRARQ